MLEFTKNVCLEGEMTEFIHKPYITFCGRMFSWA